MYKEYKQFPKPECVCSIFAADDVVCVADSKLKYVTKKLQKKIKGWGGSDHNASPPIGQGSCFAWDNCWVGRNDRYDDVCLDVVFDAVLDEVCSSALDGQRHGKQRQVCMCLVNFVVLNLLLLVPLEGLPLMLNGRKEDCLLVIIKGPL